MNKEIEFTKIINERDSLINETMVTFTEIEMAIGQIKEKQNIITVNSGNREVSKSNRMKIMQDIAFINKALEANKKKIFILNTKLESMGIDIQILNDRIAQLETTIKEKEVEVTNLKTDLTKKDFEITQLNTTVTEQQTDITNKATVIDNQIAELNKAFVIYGNTKDLIAKGIISKEGGFLGIGKKDVIHFSDSVYNQIDITKVTSIPVNSKTAKLITDHPAASYELKYDDTNKVVTSLLITNPSEFWKASKYAIIETK